MTKHCFRRFTSEQHWVFQQAIMASKHAQNTLAFSKMGRQGNGVMKGNFHH